MIKLLILDVDGVLTDGTKTYDKNHNVLTKRFKCKDFTAIKRFMAAGINVVLVSGDEWNHSMASKRNLKFHCSRGTDLSLDKSRYIALFEKEYNITANEMAFVGDDYFDLSMFEALQYTFCTSDSPFIIQENAYKILRCAGGDGAIVELYDYFVMKGWIQDADPEKIAVLDKQELASQEMK